MPDLGPFWGYMQKVQCDVFHYLLFPVVTICVNASTNLHAYLLL